jgi:hypothetical protein
LNSPFGSSSSHKSREIVRKEGKDFVIVPLPSTAKVESRKDWKVRKSLFEVVYRHYFRHWKASERKNVKRETKGRKFVLFCCRPTPSPPPPPVEARKGSKERTGEINNEVFKTRRKAHRA